jgi:translation initiation factor 2 subunit 2
MDYETLLNKVYDKLPKAVKSGERFDMPVVEIALQGSQTIIKNFSHVCEVLRRDPNHLLKFFTKELATPANFDGSKAILQSKLPQSLIQKKLELYVKEYVICKECGRPDTKLTKDDRITFSKCEACGAKTSVKTVK